MKRVILHAALAASLLCSAGAAQAADFIFSFSSDLSDPNVTFGVPGSVTGRILGLPEDGTDVGAMQILVDSYSPDQTLAFPIDVTSWIAQQENFFTVEGGLIVEAIFRADNGFEGTPSFDQLWINVPIHESGGTNFASFGSNNTVAIWNNLGLAGITFSRIQDPIPEPSTWTMMLLGFGAIGFAVRRARAQGRRPARAA
jgi:hypothetical protein